MKLNVLPFGSIFTRNIRKSDKKWTAEELSTNKIELRLRAVELVQALESCYRAGNEVNSYHAGDIQTCRKVFASAMNRFEKAQEFVDAMRLPREVSALVEQIHSLAHCLASRPIETLEIKDVSRLRELVDQLKASLDY